MKKALKSHEFWAGIVVAVVVLSIWPRLSPRTMLAKPKGQ